jgi:chemotaxis protein CheX
MQNLNEEELKSFVDSVKRYFQAVTRNEPQITSAFLATGDIQAHDFSGMVSFTGSYQGHVLVSMPPRLLRELLLIQHETDLSERNMLDAVGEIANTLAGNARNFFGPELHITVPIKFKGQATPKERVRKLPYIITLRWNHQPALVCIDMERRA